MIGSAPSKDRPFLPRQALEDHPSVPTRDHEDVEVTRPLDPFQAFDLPPVTGVSLVDFLLDSKEHTVVWNWKTGHVLPQWYAQVLINPLLVFSLTDLT